MKEHIVLFIFLACYSVVYAQETANFPPPQTPLEVTVIKATSSIKIDGILDETDWENAPITDDFFRIEPNQGGANKYKTEVRFLYDDKNLYVGAFCKDSVGLKGIRVQDLRRDFLFGENDIIAIQLDAQNTKQYAVSFQTTPYGNQRDAQIFNDNNTDNDWNALWFVKTTRTEDGYYAEFAIPFKSLRYDKPEDGKPVEWGLTMFRLARREYEQTVFPAIPQAYSPYRMTYAAKLTGLEVPEPSANIRIEPYSLYQFDESKSGDAVTASDNQLKVGGDVKWAINPNAVLDLTINTDFAQADVDRAVNNLERFNIFFPERRQFFLENSGIWAGASDFAVVPFFSRRIGLQGGFNAEPAPLDVGARFTDKDENRTLAGLYVHQRETDNSAAANFGIFRYAQNYGKENNVGVMLTHRLDESFSELGLDRANNTTLTVDGLIRPKNELTLEYLGSGSYDEATNIKGIAGKVFAGYQANNFYAGWLTNFVSRDYLSGTGFVFQNDVIQHNPGGYYIWRPEKIKWIRRWDPGVFVDFYHDFENPENFQQASINIFPIFTWFKDNSFVQASLTPTWQNINFDFSPLGLAIAQGNYRYTRYLLSYNTDQSKKLSASMKYRFGNFYDGSLNTVEAGLRYAPIPHIALSGSYEHNTLKNIGILDADLETDLYTASLRLALNPKVQLSTFYQYNSFDEQGRWNVRYSWEYMPLSFIYLVFNDTQTDAFDPIQRNTQFISKITFLKQF
ncbi:carbohydrate binding family 9 domain-containing protein [Subsaximicrobium wynnwilliamsii]|uniref:Carbohydrate binding family 9 domain-containing protein n=1 Tax=Subsaximicrobium wynnwilliamsii TaxID=291179 RepID=A0A5C6ZMM2_9FLAO|nr:carbohydrate binding family 9 domain-containing protein [Subsaximicrobium wynnwilliamsii]TXD84501.1 carbohydrate binding family 9 domain-containing protein [Subsaximicrobium wynnwilliamsii]TXD90183.1 carbohydrate binding family 9 domain-containing protein [Subsaximicrobium wynnwilliamsii]TXE04234.1 carbohydrate binding family 9 domain-containing protein [Subsaximicrobium wynnwilliamsii]